MESTSKPSLTTIDDTRPPKIVGIANADHPEEHQRQLDQLLTELQKLRTMRDHLKRLHVDIRNTAHANREQCATLIAKADQHNAVAIALSRFVDTIAEALNDGGTP
jgi:hypothetical protein